MSDLNRFATWLSRRPAGGGLTLVLLLAAPLLAQPGPRWKAPDAVVRVDLGPDNGDRQITLDDEGLAIQTAPQFFMIGRSQVTIEAALPEPGRFELKVSSKALVEVRNVRVQGGQGRAEIVSLVPPLSIEDTVEKTRGPIEEVQEPARARIREKDKSLGARAMREYLDAHGEKPPADEQELRRAYVQAKADEETADVFRAKIKELIGPRPKWYRRDIEERLQANGANPRRIYHELAAVRLADEYLQRFGFQPEQRQTRYADYLERVRSRMPAIYQVVAAKTPQFDVRGLDVGETARLREALLVELDCRLYAETDPQDPNSQWFNGQRVVCQASGIKSVTINGRLDPGQHDRSDWWLLDKFTSAVTLEVPAGAGYRIETPVKQEGRATLRVVATGEKAVDYSFHLKLPAKGRGQDVSIYESPERADTKFPY